MIQQKEAASAVALFISFGAFFLSCPVVLWEGGLFAQVSADPLLQRAVVNGFSAVAFTLGVAWGIWSLSRGGAPVSKALTGVLLIAYGIAACLYGVAQAAIVAVPVSAGVAIGALMGAAFVAVVSEWSAVLARYGLRSSLIGLGVSCGIASLIGLGFVVGLLPMATGAYVLCSCLGVAAPLLHVCRSASSPAAFDDIETGHLWDSFRTMILNPSLGLFLFVFVMSARGFVFMDHRHIGAESVMAAAVIVVVLARFWPRFSLSAIYRIFLPAAGAVFIVLSSFPVTSASFAGGFVVSHAAMAVIALLALASLCAVAHAGEFAPSVVGAALAAVVSLAVLLGVNLRALVADADTLGAILLVCAMTYFVYVMLSPLADYHRLLKECEGTGNSDVPIGPAAADAGSFAAADRETVCRQLSDEKGLSMREREILPYLARGHRPAYVADVLCISEHTVRTHIRNMYRKLGVGSREDLIQLIESYGGDRSV